MKHSLTEVERRQLHEKVKPIIWVIRGVGQIKKKDVQIHATSFSISQDGLLLTSVHTFRNISNLQLKARRLEDKGFTHDATIEYIQRSWDLAMLKFEGVADCMAGKLVSSGSLSAGQVVLHIGHAHDFVGSFLIGQVAFDCVEDVSLPTDRRLCSTYESTALEITPRFRVMGDVWNENVFERLRSTDTKFEYEKNLNPAVPIIQITGFVGGEGCSGGPVFNSEGEIVGLLCSSSDGYEIAIHVTLLRHFVNLAKEHISSKAENNPTIEGTVSKRVKTQ